MSKFLINTGIKLASCALNPFTANGKLGAYLESHEQRVKL